MNILVTGASGGVGSEVVRLLSPAHRVLAPVRQELDLSDFASLDRLDLTDFDVVIHCAAANPGAYLGWHENTWQNQCQQVDINLTATLFLIKQYTRQRDRGHFIYVTSTNIDDPYPQNLFYTTSKAAVRFAADTVQKKYPNFRFTEICPGKIKTNMLRQNYQGAKKDEEIEEEYNRTPCLDPREVAEIIVDSINKGIEKIRIVPHG